MKKTTFVHCAREITSLTREDSREHEKEYVIEKTITLSRMDYENFINDFKVKRSFIEENKHLCKIDNGVFHCILVKQKNNSDGILVTSVIENLPLLFALYKQN